MGAVVGLGDVVIGLTMAGEVEEFVRCVGSGVGVERGDIVGEAGPG